MFAIAIFDVAVFSNATQTAFHWKVSKVVVLLKCLQETRPDASVRFVIAFFLSIVVLTCFAGFNCWLVF